MLIISSLVFISVPGSLTLFNYLQFWIVIGGEGGGVKQWFSRAAALNGHSFIFMHSALYIIVSIATAQSHCLSNFFFCNCFLHGDLKCKICGRSLQCQEQGVYPSRFSFCLFYEPWGKKRERKSSSGLFSSLTRALFLFHSYN